MAITQKRVIWFFIATCCFAWLGNVGNWLWPSSVWPTPLNPVGPALGALLTLTLTEGREGLLRWLGVLKKFRAPGWVYLTALVLPLVVHLVSLSLASLSGVALGPLPEREWTGLLLLIPVVLLSGPLFEETSFVGYAQVQLENDLTPLMSALLIGGGCVIWHLPMFLGWPPLGIAITVVFLVSVMVFYVWLYKSGGSVWPAVLAHLSLNYFGTHNLGRMVTNMDDTFVHYGFVAGCFAVLAIFLILRKCVTQSV